MNKIFSTERTSEEYITLNSCGIQKFYDTDGICLRENGRIDYHILYVADGFCYFTYNEETQKIPQGNIILFYPNEPQQYSFHACDKSVSYFIHFTGTGCEKILEKANPENKRVLYIGKNVHFEEVFDKLIREHSLKQHSYEMYSSGLLIELFSIISRYASIKRANIEKKQEVIMEDSLLYKYKNLEEVTVSELAAKHYLSTGRFSHIFKEVTGSSPLEYINHMKIQKAKDMIAYTDYPINKIARDIGIDDQNYFSRLFKKHTGLSPSEYRKTSFS